VLSVLASRRKRFVVLTTLAVGVLILLVTLLWFRASITEWRYGRRTFLWSAYALCGEGVPESLPETVRVGLYEEFPVPWRLDKLAVVNFPVSLALAAPSRAEFLQLRDEVRTAYPQVREIYFWPLLSQEEGYYPGAWSDPEGVRRLAGEVEGLPVLWDSEVPLGRHELQVDHWRANRRFLRRWLKDREQPVHIWRGHTSMGLNPLFLRLTALHFDPANYPQVSLHLSLG
jgi:hypothetical protein